MKNILRVLKPNEINIGLELVKPNRKEVL